MADSTQASDPSPFLYPEMACSSRSERWSVPGSNRRPPSLQSQVEVIPVWAALTRNDRD
jgi:hypothetical protein